MSAVARSPRPQGFTLVEMLVVMTLMSLIMLGMGGALRGMGQTEQRVDQRLARMDEFRVAVGFLTSIVGHVSARKSDVLPASGKPAVMFEGLPQAMAWVGVMPARDGAGGRYFFRLSVEAAQAPGQVVADNGLVLQYLPFSVGVLTPDWATAEKRVLVTQVQSLALDYQDRREDPPAWSGTWAVEDRLPAVVRLNLTTPTGPWPARFIPLRALPLGAGGSSGLAAFGGSALDD